MPPPLTSGGLLFAASRLLGANDVGAAEMPASIAEALTGGSAVFAGALAGHGDDSAIGALGGRNRAEAELAALSAGTTAVDVASFAAETSALRGAIEALRRQNAALHDPGVTTRH